MTLIELLVAISVLAVALLGFSQAIASTLRTVETTRGSGIASQAARAMVERLQAADFDQAFALYNANPADDPGGAGSAPGANFAVEGLEARLDDPDGFVGEIVMPALAAAPGVLREDLVIDAALGTPRDLSSDTFIDAADHAGDYSLLPVIVRLSWRGPGSGGRLELRTLLGGIQ